MNPLIPKPGTAYQWLPMEDPAVTDRKIKRLRSLMAGIDNVYFNIKSERHSYYQALLSLGDRRVAPAIEAAERNGQNWRAAVAETGVDADFYIFRDRSRDRRAALGHHRRRHEGDVLPRRVRQGRFAKSGRFRPSDSRRTRSCSPSFSSRKVAESDPRAPDLSRASVRAAAFGHDGSAQDAMAARSSYSWNASRIRSRSLLCAVASTMGRSSAKLRRSPLTL